MASRNSSAKTPIDVLIIGAGPAGLGVALGVSRVVLTSVVFSSGEYRNALSKHMHGMPTWEHRDAADFREATRKDILAHYDTVSFEDVGIKSLEKSQREGGGTLFKAVDDNGKEWWGRKVALATGWKDIMPGIEGYEECWVKSIFHCLFCHGYEQRDSESAGILAIDDCSAPPRALTMARFANRLARKVVIYTNGNVAATEGITALISDTNPESKTAKCISVDGRKIKKFVRRSEAGELEIFFEDGESKVEGFLGHTPKGQLNGPFVEQLGLQITPSGDYKVNPPFNETSVKGVFAAGDSSSPLKMASLAVSSGGLCAGGICISIGAED